MLKNPIRIIFARRKWKFIVPSMLFLAIYAYMHRMHITSYKSLDGKLLRSLNRTNVTTGQNFTTFTTGRITIPTLIVRIKHLTDRPTRPASQRKTMITNSSAYKINLVKKVKNIVDTKDQKTRLTTPPRLSTKKRKSTKIKTTPGPQNLHQILNISKGSYWKAPPPFNDSIMRWPPKPLKRTIPDVAVKNNHTVIPKIVHLVWFYPADKCNLRFHVYLTILSVHKFVKPDKIWIWNNNPPCGKWWEDIVATASEVELKHIDEPTHVFGQKINFPEHKADVARLRIVMEHGGIYVDTDLVALKPWDDLLYYNTVMAAPTSANLANGFIASIKNAPFLTRWYEAYETYRAASWNENSLFAPMKLAQLYPKLIHVEWDSIIRPAFIDGMNPALFKNGHLYDWSRNYGMHMYYRFHRIEHNPEDIKKINTTMGEVFRYIYYGETRLRD